MSNDAKILIVEDEEQLVRMLRSNLIQAGYGVSSARSGMEALEQMILGEFGVILLDLGLPDIDGKDLITQIRAVSSAPVIVISARESEKEKIAALDLGASDYVAKPFDMGELLARIRVALRPRVEPSPSQTQAQAQNPKTGLQIDAVSRRAIVDGTPVRLSRKETELLQLLAEAKGAIVTHETIIATMWGRGSDADFMNVRVLAWQVRRKIEPDASAPRFLIAEAREGYRLNMS